MDARDGPSRVFPVQDDDHGRRLDRVLRKLLPRAGLDRIYTALRKGQVLVEGERRPPSYRVTQGQRIRLDLPLAALTDHPAQGSDAAAVNPEAQKLVLYQGKHFVVFDKPRGLPVHGADSLATRVEGMLAALCEPSLSFRPGPVHRLDRDTSGVVIFAITLAGAQGLSAHLRERACEKTYLALLDGIVERSERWVDTIRRDRDARRTVADPEGDTAVTVVTPLCHGPSCTLARVGIETGRTHQIRAQAAIRGHPLSGDVRYGGVADPEGYVLHSARFRLPPDTALADRAVFEAPLPHGSRLVLERRRGRAALPRALEVFEAEGREARP